MRQLPGSPATSPALLTAVRARRAAARGLRARRAGLSGPILEDSRAAVLVPAPLLRVRRAWLHGLRALYDADRPLPFHHRRGRSRRRRPAGDPFVAGGGTGACRSGGASGCGAFDPAHGRIRLSDRKNRYSAPRRDLARQSAAAVGLDCRGAPGDPAPRVHTPGSPAHRPVRPCTPRLRLRERAKPSRRSGLCSAIPRWLSTRLSRGTFCRLSPKRISWPRPLGRHQGQNRR